MTEFRDGRQERLREDINRLTNIIDEIEDCASPELQPTKEQALHAVQEYRLSLSAELARLRKEEAK